MLLKEVPTARIVFSSTWRLPEHVDRLHEQWLGAGFPEALAIDGTPDIRLDETVPRFHHRGFEIKAWLDGNPDCQQWVVIDDDRLGVEGVLAPERCVFTNPARGLTEEDALRAINSLSSSLHQRSSCHPRLSAENA